MSEFDLIRHLKDAICLRPDRENSTCVVGIGDDGAVLDVPAGFQLVVCTDTLVKGVHFPESTTADAIGYKALAVNLSDLAAMGAQPAWFFMALTLPAEDPVWLESFAEGMAGLAEKTGIMLAGGDVTSGPLSVTVTALGLVEQGQALLRSGAVAGDRVVVSGRPGAAAHALAALEKGETPFPGDLDALHYPAPRIALGRALRRLAGACIDISDGLSADLGHILEQSGVGADIELDKLPCPDSLAGLVPGERWPLQLAGGDDYELCFTLPPASADRLAELSRSGGVELTVIGTVRPEHGLVFRDRDGAAYEPRWQGYRHFRGRGNSDS